MFVDFFNPLTVFENLNFVELATLIFFVLYLPRLIAYFDAFIPQEKLVNEKKNRIALLIPARNEGKTILPLLESLNKQTYDRDFFDVFVVVKEKDDPVINYAKLAKAYPLVCEDQTCKGDCLNYGFHEILTKFPGKYDAFMIVDADCVLSETYMEEMNNALVTGADVVNAKKLIKNNYFGSKEDRSMATRWNCLIWNFMDDLGNRFKSKHGFTTMTITTGILIKAHIIEKYNGWIHRSTLTEDMEFQRDCALNDYKTVYYEHAVMYIEESPTLAETNKRRSRWMDGLTNSDFLFARRLFKKRGVKAVTNNYYMFCLWIVYAFVAVMIGSFIGYSIAAGICFAKGNPVAVELAKTAIEAVAAIYGAFFVPTLVALLSNCKEMKLNVFTFIAVLFGHPVFYMGYIPIELKAIFGTKNAAGWDEIARVADNS